MFARCTESQASWPSRVRDDGRVTDRVPLPELLERSGVIAPLPAHDTGDLLAACEIMIQEGVCAWTVPWPAPATLRGLWEMFEGRAVVGVRGRVGAEDVEQIKQAGGAFIAGSLARHDVVEKATAVELASVAGAFTPAEVLRAWEMGPSAVQVTPADQVDADYANLLETEISDLRLMAAGRIDAVQTERWIAAGAAAVTPTVDLVGNALSGGVLMGLRIRSRDYAGAATRGRETRENESGLVSEIF